MFRRILLPLDGSRMAESAIPAAKSIAAEFGSVVTLIHLLERNAPNSVHGERHLRSAAEAEDYLSDISRRCFGDAVEVEIHVHAEEVRDVPGGLKEHSEELAQDLIVMSVHGSEGLKGTVLGNIAERIVSLQTVPVLLVKPDEPTAVSFRNILVAIDGNPEHEASVPIAEAIARQSKAKIGLVTVVPSWGALKGTGRVADIFLPMASSAASAEAEQDAREHLADIEKRLRASGVDSHFTVRRGDPARKIAKLAREESVDLVVLGTHGKTGMKAFWAGSEAGKIVDRLKTPALLVPSQGQGPASREE